MIPAYKITKIKVTTDNNPQYHHISEVFCHWVEASIQKPVNGWLLRQDVAEQIYKGQATATVTVDGITVNVITEKWTNGNIYLKTMPDYTKKDNLLNLPTYYNDKLLN